MLTAVRRRRSQAARHGGQTPLLDVGFDEDKSHLAEIDVHGTGPVGTDGGEEVGDFLVMDDFFQLLAVAREKDGA